MGPWDAIGNLLVGLWRTRKLEQWLKVVLSVVLTTGNSFLGAFGWQLYHGTTFLVAVGYGCMMASGALSLLSATSPLLRGMAIATFKPALAENNGQLEVLDRSKEK